MKKTYFLMMVCFLLLQTMSYGQGPKFYLDFEGSSPLSSLPSGVTNVDGTNTVRVKNTTDYPAIPNAVQSKSTGGNELFLDFHGYLKVDVPNPSNGFTIAYDYRRNNANDDWWLGFLSFIGVEGAANKLEPIQIREWSGQLDFAGTQSYNPYPIWFDTDYKIVVTCSASGDINLYVDNVLKLSVPNATSGKNIHTWTNASLLLKFKGGSFDGTNVTPEGSYATDARDNRAFVDNVALFERELSPSEVSYINTNGNNTNPTPSLVEGAKFYLDFENANPLSNLPSGVANVDGTNTVRVKNTTDFPAIPNAVQPDNEGGKDLLLDFHGYLKVDVPDPSNGFTIAYDYKRTWDNDDWWLGFLTFIGNDGSSNRLEQLLIKEWSGQLTFNGVDSFNPYPVWFDTNYKIVITCNTSGDIKVYVDNVLKLVAPNAVSGKNIHTWTNASLLLSFKGSSFDGTTVTPEPSYATNSGDTRAYIDNVALFEMELSAANVAELYNNGNNTFGVISEIPTAFEDFCKGATIATATGSTSLKFYAAATGGIALAGTTALVNAKTYFVTETINSVESARVSRLITVNNLPATPSALISTESKNICKYIGTSTPVTFTATASGAVSYIWTVPAGATIATGNGTSSIGVSFDATTTTTGAIGSVTVRSVDANGCTSVAKSLALTTVLPKAPASLIMTSTDNASHFNLKDPVTTLTNVVGLNALAKITKVGPYMKTGTVFTLTAAAAPTAASYAWTLPTGVTPIDAVNSNVLTVTFDGAALGTTGSLPFVVKSVGGCGESVARTLTLARAVPSSPSKLVLTEDASTVAITKVGAYTQKSTALTLTATPVLVQGATATSYAWVLPTGVVCTSCAGAPDTTVSVTSIDPITLLPVTSSVAAFSSPANTITVNFSGAETAGVLKFALSVYAVNGSGNSKARTLSVSAAVPATPTIVGSGGNGTATQFGSCLTKTYTATPIPGATYTWTVPAGADIVGAENGNVIVVDYSLATGIAVGASAAVTCFATNGTGNSATKSLTVKRVACTPAKLSDSSDANDFSVIAYPNPSSSEFTIESSAKGATSFQVYDIQGRLIENRKANSNSVQIGSRYAAGAYNVIVNQGANTKSIRVIKK